MQAGTDSDHKDFMEREGGAHFRTYDTIYQACGVPDPDRKFLSSKESDEYVGDNILTAEQKRDIDQEAKRKVGRDLLGEKPLG